MVPNDTNRWIETPELELFADTVRQMDAQKFSNFFSTFSKLHHDLALMTFVYPGLVPLERHANAYSLSLYKERWLRRDRAEVARAATRTQ